MKKIGLYEVSIVLFFLVVPIGAVGIEYMVPSATDILETALKWTVFSGVGLRLFSAGVKQIVTPEFTARTIFHTTDFRCIPIVREVGFANLAFGILGIVSLFYPRFRTGAAAGAGLYFLLAGLQHLFRHRQGRVGVFAMVSDFYISLLLGALLFLSFWRM